MPAYNTNPDLLDQIKELKTRIEKLEKVNVLQNATISDGGLTVTEGGSILITGGGGLTIDGTGNIVVQNGGDIIVEDSGDLKVKNSAGTVIWSAQGSLIKTDSMSLYFADETWADGATITRQGGSITVPAGYNNALVSSTVDSGATFTNGGIMTVQPVINRSSGTDYTSYAVSTGRSGGGPLSVTGAFNFAIPVTSGETLALKSMSIRTGAISSNTCNTHGSASVLFLR